MLLKKTWIPGLNVLYEPNLEGVRSPWQTNPLPAIPTSYRVRFNCPLARVESAAIRIRKGVLFINAFIGFAFL
jgi:hypothetical protein